ncbi:aminotransferase class IV [uncultured Clostridium sp.]|uniref:aminotransferase class IV n=1 Tax=uncultured Clostridium sp. TaxID=59620 RepID=UPI0028EBEF6E|nr:aminotransferase class IV [uncultured Clostridium sp.]
MLENRYFIINDEVKEVKYFDDSILKEGKCLYEVIKVKEGIPLFLERHMNRLHNSAKLTGLDIWMKDQCIEEALNKLIKNNGEEEGSLKFVLNFDKKVFLAFFEEKSFPTEKDFKEGVSICTYNRERENPNAKVLNVNFRMDLDKFMKEKNIVEALLVDRNGYITEGSKSNVFMVKGNKIITTPLKAVLPGTKRSIVLEICNNMNIEVEEKMIEEKGIWEVDGMFLTSTPFDVLPVREVNGSIINSSENIIIKKIMNEYNRIVKNYIECKIIK